MTPEAKRQWQGFRRQQADVIIANPQRYKVCEQCRSISKLSCGLCPICHGYRWETSREFVIEIAKIIGSTPFPINAGTVPRFGTEALNYFNNMGNKGRT